MDFPPKCTLPKQNQSIQITNFPKKVLRIFKINSKTLFDFNSANYPVKIFVFDKYNTFPTFRQIIFLHVAFVYKLFYVPWNTKQSQTRMVLDGFPHRAP